jgi:glutamate carboxypeptidase
MDRVADFVESFAKEEGFSVQRIPFDACGDFLIVDYNPGSEKDYLFLAHMDTVHEKGKFGYPPVKIEGDKMIGPGVIDCKGGIAISLLVMKAFANLGYDKNLRYLATSDEEVSCVLGGEKEMELFKTEAQGYKGAFNCEVSVDGEAIVSRKGIIRIDIQITGISSHSGIDYFAGKSAVREAAYKILALENESKEGGITYNCGRIQGGELFNIVPGSCKLSLEIRANTVDEMEKAYRYATSVVEKNYVEGTTSTMQICSKRMPMIHNEETHQLFEKIRKASIECGFGDMVAIESGGGSDSAYTQLAGVPSVCGLGTCGDYCHTDREYARIGSLKDRAMILAATIIGE